MREEIRKERLRRAKSFDEFYEEERDIVLNSRFSRPVAKLYLELKEVSEKWWREFLDFWQLPNDYTPKVEDKESYMKHRIEQHRQLIESYTKYLESKGYDMTGIRYRILGEQL